MAKKTIKIGLLQGNGSDLVGGGSIQLEYNLWAESQPDIQLTNLLYDEGPSLFFVQKIVAGRTLNQVQLFNEKSDIEKYFLDFDKLIILTYPFLSAEFSNEKGVAEFYEKLLTKRKELGLWSGVICYDYKKEVVLNNLGVKYPNLYKLVDVIWVNNEKNPLIPFLDEVGSTSTRMIECPQFMNDTKLTWLPVDSKTEEAKAKNQLYYHGRSLEWKGWEDIIPLKSRLADEGLLVNMSFNGITDKPNTDLPFKQNADFNGLYESGGFADEVEKDLNFFGYYSPANADELTKRAMFGVYFTNLDPRDNFLPEYAFIDFIRNGTVLIVPDWYFDGKLHPLSVDYKLIDKSPKAVGMLTWNPNSKESTKELAKMIKKLQADSNLYDKYRKIAFNYMVSSHGANSVIRKFINTK